MAASGAGRRREIVVEVDEDRAGQVTTPVRLDAGRTAETPADIEEGHASSGPDK
ncbi:hypothetical protein GCM10023191_057700 [Actinoallomurus oryzae]|uniref:Multidrug transporter n=1 Tax=Actinoallomurus oryzae TaxID=502180 RepID=A0ABP8QNJ9_9ACTN